MTVARLSVPRVPVPTFGVEEEFLVVDPGTGALLPVGPSVVTTARGLGAELWPELTPVRVESNSPVCTGVRDLRGARHRVGRRPAVRRAARRRRCAARRARPALVHRGVGRYQRLGAEFGLLAAEHDVRGCHVHVAVPDRDSAVLAGNHLRPWLPALLALTANSPIHRGVDTGYASWRALLCGRRPCSGAPPVFSSAADYDARVDAMVASGALLDRAMVYWDVRPSEHLPTVEVRVSDVPATVDGSVLLAVLVRALVTTALDESGPPGPPVPAEVLRAACRRAARDGTTGDALDPAAGRLVPARQRVCDLVRHVEPALRATGEARVVRQLLTKVFRDGNGAVLQRAAFRRRGRLADVVAELARHTVHDCRPAGVA